MSKSVNTTPENGRFSSDLYKTWLLVFMEAFTGNSKCLSFGV